MYEEGRTGTYRGIKYTVKHCEYFESPRMWESDTKLCIRGHRRYNFPNELDFDFKAYFNWDESEIEKITKNYHVFWIDMYDHSAIKFSLSWTWMQCMFDTIRDIWFIAIPRKLSKDKEERAIEIAKWQLEEYSNYCNWRVYEWIVDYWDWDEEYTWAFYSNDAEKEAEESCKEIIDDYLETRQKYEIEFEVIFRNKTEVFAKNKKEAEEKVKQWILSDTAYIWATYKNLSTKLLDSNNN